MTLAEAEAMMPRVQGWRLAGDVAIVADWKFKNFQEAQAFVNRAGALAEAEGHHPDIAYGWGYAKLTLTTHAINGLSENDFILAAKINEIAA